MIAYLSDFLEIENIAQKYIYNKWHEYHSIAIYFHLMMTQKCNGQVLIILFYGILAIQAISDAYKSSPSLSISSRMNITSCSVGSGTQWNTILKKFFNPFDGRGW